MFGISWDVTKINKMEEYYAFTRHDRHNLTLQFEEVNYNHVLGFFYLELCLFTFCTKLDLNYFLILLCSCLKERKFSETIIKDTFDMYIYYAERFLDT